MRRLLVLLLGASFLFAGCGGGDDGGSASDTTATTAATTAIGSETVTTADDPAAGPAETAAAPPGPGGELPDFSSDFDRVCASQVGFAGATAYDGAAAGPHPVVVFVEDDADDDTFIESGATLPEGWQVVQDDNFEDNSDLAAAQLVACANRTASTPNGTSCDFDNEGDTLTLNLVDATYELVVYEAATGAEVGSTTVEAATTDCPFFVLVDEGQTEYVNTPTADDLTTALKPFVLPG